MWKFTIRERKSTSMRWSGMEVRRKGENSSTHTRHTWRQPSNHPHQSESIILKHRIVNRDGSVSIRWIVVFLSFLQMFKSIEMFSNETPWNECWTSKWNEYVLYHVCIQMLLFCCWKEKWIEKVPKE